MTKPRILTFTEAQEHLLSQALVSANRPYLVALFGEPNSGKTEFASRFRDLAKLSGLETAWATGSRNNHDWEYANDFGVFFSHSLPAESPEKMMQHHVGKNPDKRIFIYNPLGQPVFENYEKSPNKIIRNWTQTIDLIIENPGSQMKAIW